MAAPKSRQAPKNVPDSLPKSEQGTDVLPDDARRTDPSHNPPDSLPKVEEDLSMDGGNPDHPIHDEDQEDLGPEDYEQEIEEVEETGGVRPG